jgi:hypothetical protein
MTMRDLQRLEELSSAAALGLWADDIVLALDRVTSGTAFAQTDTDLLTAAAEMLEAALERAEHPLATPKSAHGLAATTTALNLVATLARQQPGKDQQAILRAMSSILRQAATGSLGEDASERVRPVMELFGMIGEHQLVASNSVLASRKDLGAWTATPAMLSSC